MDLLDSLYRSLKQLDATLFPRNMCDLLLADLLLLGQKNVKLAVELYDRRLVGGVPVPRAFAMCLRGLVKRAVFLLQDILHPLLLAALAFALPSLDVWSVRCCVVGGRTSRRALRNKITSISLKIRAKATLSDCNVSSSTWCPLSSLPFLALLGPLSSPRRPGPCLMLYITWGGTAT
jgi:hypothetical protein